MDRASGLGGRLERKKEERRAHRAHHVTKFLPRCQTE